MVAGVEGVERHLHRVEREAELEHLEVEGWVLVTGEADEAGLAMLLGLLQRLDDAPLGLRQMWVVVVDNPMDLPQVQVVGLEAPQR